MANLWEWLRRATPRGTLETSLLADGGHAGRSPAGLLEALEALIEKRDRLRAAGGEVPESLQQAIERGAAMLRFFRHGDGRLALFNGGIEDDVARIDLVLARSEAKGKAPARAPHSGFERIQAGRSLVIMDVGAAFPGHERHAHAGTLSFEMSHGRERLIVNCGAFKGEDPHWRRSFRASAAHSTLIVEETNSSELRADFRIGRRPRKIEVERVEEEGNHWLRAAHDGYEARFGSFIIARSFSPPRVRICAAKTVSPVLPAAGSRCASISIPRSRPRLPRMGNRSCCARPPAAAGAFARRER